MKTIKNRSCALTIANALKKEGIPFGEAQRKAWQIVHCLCEMQKTEVVLQFTKKGEEIPTQRTASLCPAFLPANVTTMTAKPRKKNPLQINFFDTCKNEWRSFMAPNFVGFKSQIPF